MLRKKILMEEFREGVYVELERRPRVEGHQSFGIVEINCSVEGLQNIEAEICKG